MARGRLIEQLLFIHPDVVGKSTTCCAGSSCVEASIAALSIFAKAAGAWPRN
jgi:hypothetical protein